MQLQSIILCKQKNDEKETTGQASGAAKYAVACSVLTVVLAGGISLAHLFPITSIFVVGTPVEGILSFILAAMWAAAVSVITNTSNNLATAEGSDNQVQNGNLYYFSWACFVTSIILLVNYVRAVFGIDVVGEVRNRGARVSLWAALIAAALVVVGSSARVLTDDCSDVNGSSEFCRRTKFGISVGAISAFFSIVVVAMKTCMMSGFAAFSEFVISIFLAILNAFGVAYITSNKGPGAPIGNLYYFSWISFIVAAFLAAECVGEFRGISDASQTNSNGIPEQKPDHNGDIQVESLDDV